MLLENYLDLGILLMRLMAVSTGREITFKDKKIIIKGQGGKVTELLDVTCMTMANIERAIEVAID